MRLPTPSEREKRARLRELLDVGMVMVHVDTRQENVDVPPHLAGEPALALNLSRRFKSPVEVGPTQVKATLSFGGVRYECHLPWSAIFSMRSHVDDTHYIFPDDVPTELHEAFVPPPSSAQPEPDPDEPDPQPTRPTLRLVD